MGMRILNGLGVAALVAGMGMTVRAADYTWLNTLPNWGDAGAWDVGTWADGNNAKFTVDGSSVTVAGAVTAGRITAEANTTIAAADGDNPPAVTVNGYLKVSSGKTLTMQAPLNQASSDVGARLLRDDAGTLDIQGGGSIYRVQVNNGTTKVSGGSTVTLTGASSGSSSASGALLGCSGGRLVVEGAGSKVAFANTTSYLPISGTEVVVQDGGTLDASKVNETLNGFADNGSASDHASITVRNGGTFMAKQIRVGKVSPSVFDAKPDYARIHVETGGVLQVQQFTMDAQGDYSGEVDFNGGILELAGAVTVPFMEKPLLRYAVREGGAHLRIPSTSRTFNKAFEGAAAQDGGLTVEGGNGVVVYMNAANTFNGPTTLTGSGGLIYVPKNDASLGAVPAEPTDNIVFKTGGPILHADYSYDVHSNRTLRIEKNVGARIGNGGAMRVRGAIRGDEASPQTTVLNVVNSWNGSLNLAPAEGRENRFGRLTCYGHVVVESGTTKVTSTATATAGSAPVYVCGNGSAFNASKGVLDVTGGVFKVTDTGHLAWLDVSKYGQVRVSGGTFDCVESKEYLNALGSPALTEVSGTGLIKAYIMRVSQTTACDADGLPLARIHVATGGTIQVHHFSIDANAKPKGRVDMDGGTIKARSKRDNMFGTGTGAWTEILFRVCAGGAVIDTAGVNISVMAPFLTGVAGGVDGGLTKKGSGALYMRNAGFTYTGPTRTDKGQLIFEGTDGTAFDLPGDLAVSVTELAKLTAGERAGTYIQAKSLKAGAKVRVYDEPEVGPGEDPRDGFGKKIAILKVATPIADRPEVVLVDKDGNEKPAGKWGVTLSEDRKTLYFGTARGMMVIVR